MSAHIILPSEYRMVPWRNGGGTTAEIAFAPGRDGRFAWRLSIANVTTSGPFSDYAGYDRIIAVTAGAGMRLNVAGRDPIELTQESAPFRFSGSDATSCTLLSGPIRDFNLIFDPSLVDARLIRIGPGRSSFFGDVATFVYAQADATVTHDKIGAKELPAGSTSRLGEVSGPLSVSTGTVLAVTVAENERLTQPTVRSAT